MILETSFILDYLKGEKSAALKMHHIVDENEEVGIATPTIFELWTGLSAFQQRNDEKERINNIIKDQILYPLDKESAEIAGKINGELIKKGLQIDPEDCMIAGIAITNNKKLLTRDVHFNRIEGLKVESY